MGVEIIVVEVYDAIALRFSRNSTAMSSQAPRKVYLVGSRIRELRKGRHLTQTELSDKIGIAQSDLSRMEQGEYKVGLDTLFKVLQVFELKMGEFFGETEDSQAAETRELVREFQEISSKAQREVRDFLRFKKLQEQNPEAEPAAPGTLNEEETS
jgi:transcriptional regulator with XRE-family HTH domain